MAVETTSNRISYTGNGSTVDFAVPYAVVDGETDLDVYIDGVLKTYSTDYTWAAASVGGTITTNSAVPNGDVILIVRNTTKTQPNRITTVGRQPSSVIETGLDRVTLIVQEAADDANRAIRLGETFSDTFDTELPGTLTGRRALLINTDADGFELSDFDPDENVSAAAASAVAADASADAAAASAVAADASADAAAASAASIALTTKGDLLTRTASATTRLPVGVDNRILKADSTATEGVLWATGASVLGTSTNDSATAGCIGEYVSSTLAIGSATSMTSGTAKTITSISLTAGDWDVWGTIGFIPAGTTSTTIEGGCISLTNNTFDTSPTDGGVFFVPHAAFVTGGTGIVRPCGTRRLSLASTTTVYLVGSCTFSVSTLTAYGFIGARRRR